GLPLVQGLDAAADAGDEPLPGQARQVAADRHLGNGESLRKFRNLNVIATLEQAKHVSHPFLLRQVAKFGGVVDAGDLTPVLLVSQWLQKYLRHRSKRK